MQNCASAIFRISGTHAKFNKLSKNWVHLIQFTRYSFKNLLSTLYSMKQTNVYCCTMTSVWLYCCKKLLAVLNVHLRGDHYLGSMFRKLRNVAKKTGVFRTGLTSQSCKDIIWDTQMLQKIGVGGGTSYKLHCYSCKDIIWSIKCCKNKGALRSEFTRKDIL